MKVTIFALKRKVLVTILLCGFLGFLKIEHVVGQQVSVNPDAYQQEFLGTGASCGLYIGHYKSMSESNRLEASRMLFQDLKLNYIKQYEDDYPWVKPEAYDNIVMAINNAKKYNPDVKVMMCAHNLPNHLEIGGDTQDNVKGEHDPTIPGVLDSIANYYFQICKGYYDRGVVVDIFEPENENGYKETVTNLFDIAIDKFKAIMNDATINTQKIPMPLIAGPSPWCACAPKTFINGWKKDRPNAWNNVDIVTSHGYQLGTQASYQETFDVAEGKLFYQSEQTAKLQQDEKPGVDVIAEQFPDSDPPSYVYNAVIARHMMDFFNGGGNAFFHFLTNNPGGTNPALLGTKWNKWPIKAVTYYGFKHLSATHPLHSKRVSSDLIQLNKHKAVSFRKPGENVVYVHLVNLYNTFDTVSVDFKTYGIKSAQVWLTDKTHKFGKIMDETFSFSRDKLIITTTPYSVHTIKVEVEPNRFPAWIKVDDRDGLVGYDTNWKKWTGNPGYKSTETYSETTGAEATFSFTGTQVRYRGFKRNDLGHAEIFIDDTLKATVDCYASTSSYDVMLYESEVLTDGVHTIKVRVNGEKNAASTGTEIICDAFEYFSGDTTASQFIDFSEQELNTYTNQEQDSSYSIQDKGSALILQNKTWVKSSRTYNIIGTTILEFEFMSNSEGEIHGIGFDDDNTLSDTKIFNLYGTKDWGIADYNTYDTPGIYKLYQIPVGSYYTGKNMHLVFVNDSAGSSGNSYFRNVRLIESGSVKKPVTTALEESLKDAIQGITIYPNPVSDKLYIKGVLTLDEISIYNVHGSKVQCQFERNTINVSDLSKGLYILQVNNKHVLKFMKE